MTAAHTAGAVGSASDLSALVDGEADGSVAAALAHAWRDDAALQQRWHAYHLIGDALRSDELAGSGADARFLEKLRLRLDDEPVVLAPAAQTSAAAPIAHRRFGLRRWGAPAAMAAGFAAVVGSLNVVPSATLGGDAVVAAGAAQSSLTAAAVAPPMARAVSTVPPPELAAGLQAQEPVLSIDGSTIRDARLDQYLAAHQQFGGSTALGVPSGFLRSATYDGPSAVAAGRR